VTPPQTSTTQLISDRQERQYVLPGPFGSIEEIKRANARSGQHWFDPDTMRFFSSRAGSQIIAGRIFISSERFEMPDPSLSGPRLYTIRIATDTGEVGDLSDFQQFRSASGARAAALRMVR
jgi:hypothetical protein